MMNGASVLEGYVPDMDATIVTRLLDAGAEVVGKAVCEYFSVSGGSYTSASGVVQSPRNPGYTPGGSSTGSAALVAAGEVDMAIGGDQAGSIRVPASYSGIVGIKPTYGLVPYTGIMGIEATIDHAGPLTADVASNALFLEVLAGEDGLDSRQRVPTDYHCTHLLDKGAKGLKIAVVKEGFDRHDSEPDVDASVRAAAKRFETLGAIVHEVSIPMHRLGLAIWGPIALGGMYHTMLRGYGFGHKSSGAPSPPFRRGTRMGTPGLSGIRAGSP
jgi:amidase